VESAKVVLISTTTAASPIRPRTNLL
jgi:hypothetical protein